MVGRVYVKTYESNALATDMLIEANLPMTGEKQLTLDILNSGNLFARTYITSNLAEIIAGVDNVTKGEEMKIINTGAVSYTHLDVYKRQVRKDVT